MKLIDKSALVAEIEKRIEYNTEWKDVCKTLAVLAANQAIEEDKKILSIIDTLEVKEVDLQSEIDRVWDNTSDNFSEDGWKEFEEIAKHFFELGTRIKKEEKYETPSVSKTEDVSVASRMAMIDNDLKPIAEFIFDYANWNLHKDEWNHPVLEVPLFRVLDALIQRGKPYCGKN